MDSDQRILILTAFPAEADAILARVTLDEDPVVEVNRRRHYRGTLGGRKVIVAMTGIGMRNAAEATRCVLHGLAPRAVVFAGVAGGAVRTRIGDVAIPARWTCDQTTWHAVDREMLAVAEGLAVELVGTGLRRVPLLHVGGDGFSGDHNNGTAFPAIPFGGAVFGPQPRAAPDYSPLYPGNFFGAIGPFLVRGVVGNLTGFFRAGNPEVDAVDQETAAAQQVADAYGVPFIGIRGMSDGPGDPRKLPGFPVTFFVYKTIAAGNAAIVTEAFLQNWGDA
ncbi:hypothetical protein [Mycolicibacterium sp. 120270]|uniref:5'-methylthioadenosine/S-adenosylhomocysteine nucleosidase family protein n=1 Tax=Mycolicibacterium sp. 120270 TaxID=3090600 RepID=UPI00299EDC18|nr:hypothetical protein [Mycolicibacterium sp. 120270]MDX1883833.1 hypothetical protein [Mycolicibacterium sp. 120270]